MPEHNQFKPAHKFSSMAALFFLFSLIMLQSFTPLPIGFIAFAAEIDSSAALVAASGWLRLGTDPIESFSDREPGFVETFTGEDLKPLFHAVSLIPEGYILISADDRIEPVISFSPRGSFSPDRTLNPLAALVFPDMETRLTAVSPIIEKDSQEAAPQTESADETAIADRWSLFTEIGSLTAPSMKEVSVSDERVAPLITTRWGQSTYNGDNLYNYYTPSNWLSGCVATAMGQVMFFHQHPTTGVGTASFSITVDGASENRNLRGGDGSGGAYLWGSMPAVPDGSITVAQRQAIGNLLHDAGISVNMAYTSGDSSTDTLKSALVLKSTFGYTNAVRGYNSTNDLGAALTEMVNPNLDAGLPVIFGIATLDNSAGHAVVCDGYGYNNSNLYHHLNMGWTGSQDAWYDLPTVDTTSRTYDKVYKCVYNIFKTGTGEIISGRVLDTAGQPVTGATVTATKSGGGQYQATTDAKGIYALKAIPASASYSIQPAKTGLTFSAQTVSTGASSDLAATSGNRWAVDFQASASTFPTISSAAIATDNSYVDINFSEGVFANSNSTGGLDATDLALTFAANGGTATNVTKGALNKITGGALAGGETSARLSLTITGTPSGHETIELRPAGASSIYDNQGNAMSTAQTTGAINLYGSSGPVVTMVSSTTADGSYRVGAAIAVTVTFSAAVNVTGQPRIQLETGANDRYANYSAGSGTATLTFNYTVQATDTSSDLDYRTTTSLELNEGTIKSTTDLNAILTLPSPGSVKSLAGQKALAVDTTQPTVLSVSSSTSDGTYGPDQVVNVTVTFSENVRVDIQESGPTLLMQVGNGGRDAQYSTGTGTTFLSFSYTVVTGDTSADLDCVDTGSLVTNGSAITDTAGNAAILTLPAPGTPFSLGANKNIRIDGQAASITSVTCSSPDGSYRSGETLTITLNFSENVIVTGTPKLSLASAALNPGTASLASGSGTTALNFTYTIRDNDNSSDLDVFSTTLDLSSATVKDANGNPVNPTIPSPGTPGSLSAARQIVLDTAKPLFQGGSVAAGNSWATISFNESVFGDVDAGTPIAADDLAVAFESNGGGAIALSIASLTRTDGSPLLGGETSVKANLTIQGGASGVETFKLTPTAADRIFDSAGNAMGQTTESSQMTLSRQVLYVKSGASGNNSGSTWANAFPELRDALTASVTGDQIWVAAGTYKPTSVSDRTVVFATKAGVSIIGGFAGTELSVDQRNWRTNRTILSGDIGTASLSTDNSIHVVDASAGGTLDGLVITGGYADGQTGNSGRGGAILASGASGSAALMVRNCELSANYALTQGGACYFTASGVTLETCTVLTNSAGQEGGAIYYQSCTGGIITGCLFKGNSSARSGAMTLNFSTPPVHNSIFFENTATERGGALTISGYEPAVANCTFQSNTSTLGRDLFCYNSSPKISSSVFWSATPLPQGTLAVSSQGAYPQFLNCDIQGCGASGDGWSASIGTDLGFNLDTDPGFTAAADVDGADNIFPSADDGLRQTSASAMLNSGDASTATSKDILGNPRPSGPAPDMGPYEGPASLTPYIVSVTSPTPSKAFGTGGSLSITVNFNIAVTVAGSPTLDLNTGQDNGAAIYASGSTTTALTFTYTVIQGDLSQNLDYMDPTSLKLNGGSITAPGGAAVLTLPPTGSASSLGGSTSIVLDTIAPSDVAIGTLSADNLWVRLNFSEGLYGDQAALTPLATGDFSLLFTANGGTATGASITGITKVDGTPLTGGETDVRVLLSVTGTPSGAETIEVKAAGAGLIFDIAGNPAPDTLTTGQINLNPPGAPRVVSLAFNVADDFYRSGDVITMSMTFDKAVTVTGSPKLKLSTGTADAAAAFTGGSATTILTFSYTVVSTDETGLMALDQSGIDALDLSSATIVAATGGIPAATLLPEKGAAGSLGQSGTVVLDNTGPLLTSGTIAEFNAHAVLNFSEGVFRSSAGTGGLQPGDLKLTFAANGGTAGGVSITALKTITGTDLKGGEKTIHALLSVLSRASGSETIDIGLASTAQVYDRAGNPAGLTPGGATVETGTTGPMRLFPWTSGSPPVFRGVLNAMVMDRNIPLTLDLTPWESDPEDGIEGATTLRWTVSGQDSCTVTGFESDNDILTFTPATDFTGADNLTLTLTDSDGNSVQTDLDMVWIPHTSSKLPPVSWSSSMTSWPGYPITSLGDGKAIYQQDFAAKVGTSADSWITLDLGSDKIVSRIVVVNDGEYGATAVSVSGAPEDSPTQFQSLSYNGNLSGEAGTPRATTLCINPAKVRYLRLLFTGFHLSGWFQMNEIEVWGDTAGTAASRAIASASSAPLPKPGRGAELLVDGQVTLNGDWSANHGGNPVEIKLDLGETTEVWGFSMYNDGVYGVSRVRLLAAETDNPASYQMQGAWDDLSSRSGEPLENKRFTQPFQGRYLIFSVSGFINDTSVGINEIQVFGQGAAGTGTERIAISTISTTPQGYPGFGASKLKDGLYFFNSDYAVWNKGAATEVLLDMSADRSIDYLKVFNDGQYGATGVSVEIAVDDASGQPQSWTAAGSFTGLDTTAGTPRPNTLEIEGTVTARWVRLKFTAFADSQWFQMNEIETWGPSGQTPSASGKVAIVSIVSSVAAFPGYGADTLHDGASVFNSDFACRNSGTETALTLDLGSDKSFNSLNLVNDGEFGTSAISVDAATAANPANFTSLGDFSGLMGQTGSPTSNRIVLPATTARYVRVRARTFLDPIWFQLNEIEILNGDSASRVVASEISSDTTPIPGYGTDSLSDNERTFNGDFACRHSARVTLYFDFGSDVRINRVVHVNDGQYGAAAVTVKWASSASPSTWNTAGSFNLSRNNDNPSEDSLTFATITCRYISLVYDSFGDATWFQLNEIEFYEDAASEGMASESSYRVFISARPAVEERAAEETFTGMPATTVPATAPTTSSITPGTSPASIRITETGWILLSDSSEDSGKGSGEGSDGSSDGSSIKNGEDEVHNPLNVPVLTADQTRPGHFPLDVLILDFQYSNEVTKQETPLMKLPAVLVIITEKTSLSESLIPNILEKAGTNVLYLNKSQWNSKSPEEHLADVRDCLKSSIIAIDPIESVSAYAAGNQFSSCQLLNIMDQLNSGESNCSEINISEFKSLVKQWTVASEVEISKHVKIQTALKFLKILERLKAADSPENYPESYYESFRSLNTEKMKKLRRATLHFLLLMSSGNYDF
ncbi:MAG: hypothetical protein CVV64_11995 [Candidatus Wallbacteria bacterium HGW-Wallbacteria-1]|jgi:hypothetical protein|uniref:Spi protease inhibitor domain-containing protein n=1 Tax=Candidatus Wallbacteria bacterium HGW-Wallbacteria-1 TaxID=2013854 RepID=A0A2N1PNE1_9BACT|nr:MAG: hypothetical protein CVV64_11995 [Candidatus Wallbacteria bacterium HGW-Wallbacteria-1]